MATHKYRSPDLADRTEALPANQSHALDGSRTFGLAVVETQLWTEWSDVNR